MCDAVMTDAMQTLRYPLPDAYVGIGWWHPEKNVLFGNEKVLIHNAVYNRFGATTTNKLHKNIWYRVKRLEEPSLTEGFKDYTQCPRFRVYYYREDLVDSHWKVYCGKEIDASEDAKALIMDEYNLYDTDVQFYQDMHWQVGHGWSKDYMDGLK